MKRGNSASVYDDKDLRDCLSAPAVRSATAASVGGRGGVVALASGSPARTVLMRPGLILVDSSLGLVAANDEAIQILTFPQHPKKIPDLPAWLANKIRSTLVDERSPDLTSFVSQFRSAKRTYVCRCLQLHGSFSSRRPHPPATALLLERKSNGAIAMAEIFQRFGLTAREQEAVRLLARGLTSKEIAERMRISPHTVNVFIRLVMVKMNVSKRLGIIAKVAGPPGMIPTGVPATRAK